MWAGCTTSGWALTCIGREATLSRTPVRRGWKARARRFLAINPTCIACGAPATDVDHVTPRSHDGGDEWGNLAALCHSCHSRKTTTIEQHGWSQFNARVKQPRQVTTTVNQW